MFPTLAVWEDGTYGARFANGARWTFNQVMVTLLRWLSGQGNVAPS
jgi:hypothetical protein